MAWNIDEESPGQGHEEKAYNFTHQREGEFFFIAVTLNDITYQASERQISVHVIQEQKRHYSLFVLTVLDG